MNTNQEIKNGGLEWYTPREQVNPVNYVNSGDSGNSGNSRAATVSEAMLLKMTV